MLNEIGFDLWADGYDRSVGLSEEGNTYPFAGYRRVLNTIYQQILTRSHPVVLDIGFGTGTLTAKLYEQGCTIYGQDFSRRMIELAQEKMPNARLYQGDFSHGLVEELRHKTFDAIVATYSLHHLTDEEKVHFLQQLRGMLREGGCIYVGDVAFETREELEQCKKSAGGEWDEEEIYFVYDELHREILSLRLSDAPAAPVC